jgi:hypothetical protein
MKSLEDNFIEDFSWSRKSLEDMVNVVPEGHVKQNFSKFPSISVFSQPYF